MHTCLMCSVSFKSEGQKQDKVQERICKMGILSKLIKLWLQDKCHQIFNHHACHLKSVWLATSFIFQHENEPKHITNAVKAYLDRKTHNGALSVMDQPPRRLDLNIIRALWIHIDN